MNLTVAIYSAILFFVLTPNVFLRLPPHGSKMMVAAVHALVFALILYLTQKFVWKFSVGLEGNAPMSPTTPYHSDPKQKK
jgi:hypothetical protein